MNEILDRELKVAFSKKAQPVWFRVVKWIALLAGSVAVAKAGYFWQWLSAWLTAGLSLHMLYRWKTQAWTRPWGGWNDVESWRKS